MNPYAPHAPPPPQNPYAAPQNSYYPPAPQYSYAPPRYAYAPPREAYVPLGWRTWLATLGIAAVAVTGFGVDLMNVLFPEVGKSEDPALGPALLVLAVSLAMLAAHVFAAVFFSIWIHRAAKNLIALGRQGMQFTPGWCVGWFFVPFGNLVKPFQAMQEVWRASGPEARDGYWMGMPSTAMLGLWWGTWLFGNVLANISIRLDDPTTIAGVGAVGSLFTAIAAGAVIFLIHRIASRQAASAQMG